LCPPEFLFHPNGPGSNNLGTRKTQHRHYQHTSLTKEVTP
jgi:hypothetical protein